MARAEDHHPLLSARRRWIEVAVGDEEESVISTALMAVGSSHLWDWGRRTRRWSRTVRVARGRTLKAVNVVLYGPTVGYFVAVEKRPSCDGFLVLVLADVC